MHFKKLSKKTLWSLPVLLAASTTPMLQTTVYASVGDLPVLSEVRISAAEETDTPEIPIGECYVVVNVNIREEASKDSKICGKYKKGEKIKIISADKEWAKTEDGYIWGGYVSRSYGCDLDIHSDTEHSSLYVGSVYDIINNLEQKYINVIKKYEIHLCSNPIDSYSGRSPLDDITMNTFLNGLTHIYKMNGIDERLMYIRGCRQLEFIILHELGHAVDFEAQADLNHDQVFSEAEEVKTSYQTELSAVKKYFSITDESVKTEDEYFAEAFRLSMENHNVFEQVAPIMSAYLDQIKEELPG